MLRRGADPRKYGKRIEKRNKSRFTNFDLEDYKSIFETISKLRRHQSGKYSTNIMRTFIWLTLLAAACYGCGGAEQAADNINTLAKEWDAATMEVTGAVNRIAEAQENVNETLNRLIETKQLTGTPENEQQALRENLEAHSENLAEYAEQAFEFVNQWQEGAEQLDKLKTGMKTGELPGDTEGQLQNLRDMISTGRAKAETWHQAAEEAEATTDRAQSLMQ